MGWPGYRVYQNEINERAKTLKLWVWRKAGNRKLVCSGCGRRVSKLHEVYEREVRDLPCLAESTVRALDLRYLERWGAARRKPALRQIGVDEIHIGKKQKFLTLVCNLETGEPLWFGRERKKETLDTFFQEELSARQRRGIEAACVDMWAPFRLSIEQWAPRCRIVYDKFHIMQHANAAIDEVRRAEFFRKGRRMRGLVKGKRWLLLKPMGEPHGGQAPGAEPTLRAQPESVQSPHPQRESGPAMDVPL